MHDLNTETNALQISLHILHLFEERICSKIDLFADSLLWNCGQVSSSSRIIVLFMIPRSAQLEHLCQAYTWQTDKLRHISVRNLPASEMRKHLRPPLVRWVDERCVPLCGLNGAAFHCAVIPVANALTYC